jgi:K+-transporting ATPase ATPase A chain
VQRFVFRGLAAQPAAFSAQQMPARLAFNTAVSFTTNTNWQSYSPEVTVSYFSNMVALAIHNWASSAVGLAIAIGDPRLRAQELQHDR